jgi:hypothetical protein
MANAMQVVITEAGLAELINAEQSGTAHVVLSQVAFGTGQYIASETQTALMNEIKRVDTIKGGAVGDNTIHITATDSSGDAYAIYEVGVYTESGVLFAVYSQNTPIVEKASGSEMMLAIDIILVNGNPENVVVPDTSFVLTPATTDIVGIVELATPEETIAGNDSIRAVTPAGLSARTSTSGRAGLIQIATSQEAIAGTNNSKAITPLSMATAFVKTHADAGYQKLPNGFIIQWGKALIANGGSGTTITFPLAFPNGCKSCVVNSADSASISFVVASLAQGSANIRHNGNGGVNAYWVALGF